MNLWSNSYRGPLLSSTRCVKWRFHLGRVRKGRDLIRGIACGNREPLVMFALQTIWFAPSTSSGDCRVYWKRVAGSGRHIVHHQLVVATTGLLGAILAKVHDFPSMRTRACPVALWRAYMDCCFFMTCGSQTKWGVKRVVNRFTPNCLQRQVSI